MKGRRSLVAICLVLILAVIMLIGACAQPAPAPAPAPAPTPAPAPAVPKATYEWKLGQPMTEPSLQFELVEDLVQRIDTASGGRIKITHYPGSLLGDYVKQQQAVAAGEQEIAIVWPMTTVIGASGDIRSLGFVYRDTESFIQGMKDFGLKTMSDLFEANADWKVLGAVLDGPTAILSTKKFDPMPGSKGLKMRVMPLSLVQSRYEAMGFNTVTMAYGEVPGALKLGTIDATADATWSEASTRYIDVVDYAYKYSTIYSEQFLIMNGTLFKSMSAEDQALLAKVCQDWTWESAVKIDAKTLSMEQEVRDFGVEVIEITDEQWKANAKVARAVEWPIMEAIVGKDIMDAFTARAYPID